MHQRGKVVEDAGRHLDKMARVFDYQKWAWKLGHPRSRHMLVNFQNISSMKCNTGIKRGYRYDIKGMNLATNAKIRELVGKPERTTASAQYQTR